MIGRRDAGTWKPLEQPDEQGMEKFGRALEQAPVPSPNALRRLKPIAASVSAPITSYRRLLPDRRRCGMTERAVGRRS